MSDFTNYIQPHNSRSFCRSVLLVALNLLFLFFAHKSVAQANQQAPNQCSNMLMLNSENINQIHAPFQLSFLSEIPENRLDRLVQRIIQLQRHNEIGGLVNNHKKAEALFDSIGQLRTLEAYSLLYVLSELTFEEWSDKPIKSGALGGFYSFAPINKYYFNSAVPIENNQNFNWEVRALYRESPPVVYFCPPEHIEEPKELDRIPKPEDLWKVSEAKASQIILKDTIGDFVVDSIVHDLGAINKESQSVIKYFKYIGEEAIRMTNLNDDPHFITEYNEFTLVPGQVYQFTAILTNSSGAEGAFTSRMGFNLSNGTDLLFDFGGVFE